MIRSHFIVCMMLFCPAALSAQGPNSIISEIAHTTQTVTGQPIEVVEQPEFVVSRITIGVGQRLPIHKHPYQRIGYLVSGTLDLVDVARNTRKTYKAGDMVIEMRDEWHYGENISNQPAELLLIDTVPIGSKSNITLNNGGNIPFPAGKHERFSKTWADQPISVTRHPEIRANIYDIMAHSVFPLHKHDHQRVFYVLSGEVDLIDAETKRRETIGEGNFVVESLKLWHYGENNGDVTAHILVIDFVPPNSPNNTILKSSLL
ncbi:MAG: cupin domain-containing protein [Rickettsiales bacterium]